MFISRKKVKELEAQIRRLDGLRYTEWCGVQKRIDSLEKKLTTVGNGVCDLEGLHYGLEKRMSEAERLIRDYNGKLKDLGVKVMELEAKTSVLDEYAEAEEEDRKAERSFLQGIQNIMNFRG